MAVVVRGIMFAGAEFAPVWCPGVKSTPLIFHPLRFLLRSVKDRISFLLEGESSTGNNVHRSAFFLFFLLCGGGGGGRGVYARVRVCVRACVCV